MYSLLMSGNEELWDKGYATFGTDRFLECTVEPLKDRFRSLTDEAIQEIKGMPALFSYEKSCERAARLGWITDIRRHAGSLEIKFYFDEKFDPLEPDRFQSLLAKLDVEPRFEVHRTHWAIKEVDLIDVLTSAGLFIPAQPPKEHVYEFSRATIIAAATMLKTMGHSDMDEFLLELSVDGLSAGRPLGSRQARAVEIGKFVVEQPDAQTAEGEMIALAVVRRAALIDHKFPEGVLYEVADAVRRRFWDSLRRDGYRLTDGQIVPNTDQDTQSTAEEVETKMAATPKPIKASNEHHGRDTSMPAKVFVVHGRQNAAKEAVSRFLQHIGVHPVILHEQPNAGRTIFQKFQDVADEADFAVVIMTPDDVGGLKEGELKTRARQNVIFELGFFIAKLGPDKVCALVEGSVETPSDYGAVVYVSYGENTGWKGELARELRAAGISFDAHKVF